MPTLLIRFPGRRYHATPWGHHVNEGLIEWPPSPWRIIRALISVGYTKGDWDGNGPHALARSLFTKLSGKLPDYCLPQAVGTHSRHYMPMDRFEKSLVFDTWAQIDDGVLAVTWDVELDEDELALLAVLASKLSYLGRSESWVEVRLAGVGEPLPPPNCSHSDDPPIPGDEQVSLIAPLSETAFDEWRQRAIEQALRDLPSIDNTKKATKKLLEQRKKAIEPYPADLIDSMQKDTVWQRKYGWSQPPGSCRVFYHRKTDAFKVGAITRRIAPTVPPVKVMLLSMATATGNKHALPSIIHTLIHGERLHKALISIAGAHNRALSGCDKAGKPLKGRHEHAHVLPLDLDNDGHLDHFVIWSPMGLDSAAQQAVRKTRKTYAKSVKSLYVSLAASCAELSELNSLPGIYGDSLRLILGLHGATEWVSHTPFIPPRHLKPRGKNSLKSQIVSELSSRGLSEPIDVMVVNPREKPEYLKHRHFTRIRKVGPPPPIDCGFTIALRFKQPVSGPICLGYASHFGLGLFVPAGNER